MLWVPPQWFGWVSQFVHQPVGGMQRRFTGKSWAICYLIWPVPVTLGGMLWKITGWYPNPCISSACMELWIDYHDLCCDVEEAHVTATHVECGAPPVVLWLWERIAEETYWGQQIPSLDASSAGAMDSRSAVGLSGHWGHADIMQIKRRSWIWVITINKTQYLWAITDFTIPRNS